MLADPGAIVLLLIEDFVLWLEENMNDDLQAAKEPKGSEMRLMYVTAYNISCWFEQRLRMTYKPVKPVQNETFEYVDPDNKYKLLIEEVHSL